MAVQIFCRRVFPYGQQRKGQTRLFIQFSLLKESLSPDNQDALIQLSCTIAQRVFPHMLIDRTLSMSTLASHPRLHAIASYLIGRPIRRIILVEWLHVEEEYRIEGNKSHTWEIHASQSTRNASPNVILPRSYYMMIFILVVDGGG